MVAPEQQTSLPSRRDNLRNRLKAKYPDRDFDDDDNFYGQLNDDFDEYENELTTHREQASKLTDMFTSDPRTASFLQDWRNGEDPAIALVRLFGSDIKEILDDPERLDEIAEANKDYLKRVQQSKDLETQYEQNIQATIAQLEDLQRERGLSDDEVDKAMSFLVEIASNGIVGKFTPEAIEFALKAMNYDNDVEVAREEGNIQGRNEKITEKLRKPQIGDGIPHLSGASTPPPPDKPRRKTVFDRARGAI